MTPAPAAVAKNTKNAAEGEARMKLKDLVEIYEDRKRNLEQRLMNIFLSY